jgi:hypothetical protein
MRQNTIGHIRLVGHSGRFSIEAVKVVRALLPS